VVVINLAKKFIYYTKKNYKIIGICAMFFLISSIVLFVKHADKQITVSSELPLLRETIKAPLAVVATSSSIIEQMSPKKVRVVLARVYLDGEVSEEIVEETIISMEDFWAEYAEWNLVDQDEVQVVFQKNVDDISPLLKINGYFGISDEGTLNIYEGKPSGEKVIQSFFQINMKKLKSHQQQELEKGIPVISRDRYEEVLKMYQKYATQEM
jgi:forespore regulator of the sigma-K checkpoint